MSAEQRVNADQLIRDMWPERHRYFGIRLMLRSIIRMERKLRAEQV